MWRYSFARHGGAFDGAAGPVRNIAARTYDLLGTATRVAELLHPNLNLEDRIERLSLRLTLGIPASVVDLGRRAGTELTRGDYLRLVAARLCDAQSITAASDEALLSCLDADRRRLAVLRLAAAEVTSAEKQANDELPLPQLAPYTA